MQAIVAGGGPLAPQWVAALTSHRGVDRVIHVTGGDSQQSGGNADSACKDLESALTAFPEALTVLGSSDVAAAAILVLSSGRDVFLTDLSGLGGSDLDRILAAARSGHGRAFLALTETFSRSRTALRRFLDSGRVGAIGHVSCNEDRAASATRGEATGVAHMARAGAGRLAEICQILDVEPENVMARLDGDGARTVTAQAYLEASKGIHVHYSANLHACSTASSLWIEGSGGSLRTDGANVWWRKRGWRFFLPARLGRTRAETNMRQQLDRILAARATASATGGPAVDDSRVLGLAAAALTSSARRTPVALGVRVHGCVEDQSRP